jgi:hypothetical protein
MKMKYKYRLIVEAGEYQSDYLVLLILAVLSHRFHHFVKGEGWID